MISLAQISPWQKRARQASPYDHYYALFQSADVVGDAVQDELNGESG